MSHRLVLAAATVVAVLHLGAAAAAQCTKDTDCKQDRICVKGSCVEPTAASRPAPPPHPFDYRTAYVQVAGVFSPHAWAGAYEGGHGEVGVRGGVHVAVYGVSTPTEHIGGYFSYADFADASRFGAGISFKEGRRRFTRVWIGGAVDLGAFFLTQPHGVTGYGVQLFPRFELDVILGASSRTRSALFFAVGPTLVPYYQNAGGSGATAADHDHHWSVAVDLLFGVLFGG